MEDWLSIHVMKSKRLYIHTLYIHIQQCRIYYIYYYLYIYTLNYDLNGEKFNKVMVFPHLKDFLGIILE